MAVPTEKTWATRDAVSSTNLNAGVRDPLTFLMQRPTVQLRQTVAQNVTNSTWTALTFTTGEDIDSHGGHDTASNTSRYTAQEDGWYRFSGAVAFESNATNRRLTRWAKNGTEVSGSRIDTGAVSGGESIYPVRTMVISLSVGDYVELQGWQNSGATRATIVTAEMQSTLTGLWERRL